MRHRNCSRVRQPKLKPSLTIRCFSHMPDRCRIFPGTMSYPGTASGFW